MTAIQRQAIQLIQQLPDEKVRAIITLAADEVKLTSLNRKERAEKKRAAFLALEKLNLQFPEDFDPDKERAAALEEKYGPID